MSVSDSIFMFKYSFASFGVVCLQEIKVNFQCDYNFDQRIVPASEVLDGWMDDLGFYVP